jgi:hypothetical protein
MNKKIAYICVLAGGGGVLLFMLTPLVLFGTNAIVTVHDNLDSLVPWYKMFHDNDLFFKFNAPTKGFSEMSTLYYGNMGFTFQSLMYSFCNTFTAYTLNYTFSVLFGTLSMYLLLNKTFSINRLLSAGVSVCYAILPIYQGWNTAAGTLPLVIFAFFYFASRSNGRVSWKTALLLFYPFFSYFATIGFFILGLWFAGTVIVCIKNKKPNPDLIVGFIMLSAGYILTDLRLFYTMFILKTPLNRSIFSFYPDETAEELKAFPGLLKEYFADGYYHAASMQRKIILPFAKLVSVLLLPYLGSLIISKIKKGKTETAKTNNKIMLLFIIEAAVFVFSAAGALHDSGLLNGFVRSVIPVLAGFNWGRLWIFNRVLWTVIFALCLSLLMSVKNVAVSFDSGVKKIILPQIFLGITILALLFLQYAYIMRAPTLYNDSFKTWYNELVIKTGLAGKIPGGNPEEFASNNFSYKEFFSEDLFGAIKEDIGYNNEMVAAFGYHPSVLMYNGFNCIDGYNNLYPLDYMLKFRTLIAPEFETNITDRDYYDSWGGRMYLYNANLTTVPTRNKNVAPVELHIDANIFRDVFNGKYILSRAEISNANELGLSFVKRYENKNSLYTIHLYKT